MKEKFAEAGAKRADRIIEGNKIIAEFYDEIKYSYVDTHYENDWNSLVPVVHKIFSLPIEETNPLVMQLADLNMAWNRKDITEIWESCVRFVIKYQDVKR